MSPGPKSQRKVIVIDAEPTVRTTVSSILKRQGFAVTATDDLRAAFEICREDPPDLILTNVYLPGIPGHDAMRLLKERHPDIPVLMITGLPDTDMVQHWVGQDGFDVFPKPFQAADLVRKVEQILGKGPGV